MKSLRLRIIAVMFAFIFGIAGTLLAETAANTSEQVSEPAAAENVLAEHMKMEGPSTEAPQLFNIGPVPITNSMVTGWLSALILTLAAIHFHREAKAGRITRFTAAVESLVLGLHTFLSDIMGDKLAKQTFWLMASFFIFILCSNLMGILPGIGSVGWGRPSADMFEVTTPLFRGANADLNTTLALGALFFVFWFIWAWKANGPVGILQHIFGFHGEAKGIMHLVMVIVFLAVGFLELLSIIIRPFALAVRLYGNMFAGEVMLETMRHKIPWISWLLPVPFYLMEVLVDVIQALVFMLLSAVFIVLICRHEEDELPELETDI